VCVLRVLRVAECDVKWEVFAMIDLLTFSGREHVNNQGVLSTIRGLVPV
jgi:hypothetical protein